MADLRNMAKFNKDTKVWFIPCNPGRIWEGYVRHYNPAIKRYEVESYGCSFGLFERDLYRTEEEAVKALKDY